MVLSPNRLGEVKYAIIKRGSRRTGLDKTEYENKENKGEKSSNALGVCRGFLDLVDLQGIGGLLFIWRGGWLLQDILPFLQLENFLLSLIYFHSSSRHISLFTISQIFVFLLKTCHLFEEVNDEGGLTLLLLLIVTGSGKCANFSSNKEGKVYRENVKDMKGVFGDMDRQDRYVDSFVDYLVANR
ncbi:unnamed protein product [Microthlaspi erraticum]|uniref:Uncharacterized protein n=1 Tax=Microthlaspi erraticum TaxID=1685480 RepID=A0A6D2HU54_9BRAS|nr:unnamed protein product [Microthlaspi erraticum]